MNPDEEKEVIEELDNQRIYDNEWVQFTNQLSKNESLKKIAYYATNCKFTPKAKRKIIMYAYALLGRNLAVTYIHDEHDRQMLFCDKAVMDSVLKLGLTNYDVTDEFEMITNAITLQFTIMVDQARGGFERKQINMRNINTSHEEKALIQSEGGRITQIKNAVGLGKQE